MAVERSGEMLLVRLVDTTGHRYAGMCLTQSEAESLLAALKEALK